MNAFRPARSLLALALTVAAIGCSRSKDDLPREPVAGTVAMDGRPLPEGAIQFSPAADAAKAPTVGAVAEIKEGRFTIPREDGLVPGRYKVSISHAPAQAVKTKAKGALAKPTRLGKEQIPEKYNKATTLTAEIPRGGKADLDFSLQSK